MAVSRWLRMLGGSTRHVAVWFRIGIRLRMLDIDDDRLFRRVERRSDGICRERALTKDVGKTNLAGKPDLQRQGPQGDWRSCTVIRRSRSGSPRAPG